MGYKIAEIENLVIQALKVSPLDAYCKNIARYDGQFNVEDISQVQGIFPAAFVAYAGDVFEEVSPLETYNVAMRISVIVAARDMRGDFTAKTGSVGAYQMLEDVKILLHKNNLGKNDIIPLILIRRVPLINDKFLAAFGLDFKLSFRD